MDDQTQFDLLNGAHFQYKELMKRLSDITSSSQGRSSKGKRISDSDNRIPLKEKTKEIINKKVK
jgi:hypothetical protein